MTDRELLELAAEAMGIEVWFPRMRGDAGSVFEPCHYSMDGETHVWNPLTNPADTAEMCAVLEIDTEWSLYGLHSRVYLKSGEFKSTAEPHDGTTQGKLAAWMRASTRAAAEVAIARREG